MYIIHLTSALGTIDITTEAGNSLAHAVWQGQDLARKHSMQLLTNASAEQETLTLSIRAASTREEVWREDYT